MRKSFKAIVGACTLAVLVAVAVPSLASGAASAADSGNSIVATGAKFCQKLIAGTPLMPGVASAECAPATPGSSTDETGTFNRTAYDFVDAYTQDSGVAYQHQRFSILSTKANVCEHYRNNQVVASESWLILNEIAWNPDNATAAPVAATRVDIGQIKQITDPNTNVTTNYTAQATISLKGKSCNTGTQKNADSGWIDYTVMDDTTAVGTYELKFGSDVLTGSFTAPFCTQCTARPTNQTCLKI